MAVEDQNRFALQFDLYLQGTKSGTRREIRGRKKEERTNLAALALPQSLIVGEFDGGGRDEGWIDEFEVHFGKVHDGLIGSCRRAAGHRCCEGGQASKVQGCREGRGIGITTLRHTYVFCA